MSPRRRENADPPAATADAADNATLFEWRRRNRSLRLPIYMLVSIALLSLFFYLFQVTYPTPERTLPRAERITLLSPSDPAARGLLTRLADRTVALALPLEPLRDAIKWDEFTVRLTPSFEDHEFRPDDIAAIADQSALPDLFTPGTLRRPALDLPELPPAPTPDGRGQAVWTLEPGGPLAAWTVSEAPVFKTSPIEAVDSPSPEFVAGVDRYGRVRFLMPAGPSQPELERAVAEQVHLIRLAPPLNNADHLPELIWGILRCRPSDP